MPRLLTKDEKSRWLQALRSGEYKQGNGALCVSNGETKEYCCLGVLADIIDPTKFEPYNGRTYWQWGGLGQLFATRIMPSEHEQRLILMNDKGDSFSIIADWIETNIPTKG